MGGCRMGRMHDICHFVICKPSKGRLPKKITGKCRNFTPSPLFENPMFVRKKIMVYYVFQDIKEHFWFSQKFGESRNG